MTADIPAILALADAEPPLSVPEIGARSSLTASEVYSILRKHRPHRKRKVRIKTSGLRPRIIGLKAAGVPPARIAMLLDCRRQYVYKILGERG